MSRWFGAKLKKEDINSGELYELISQHSLSKLRLHMYICIYTHISILETTVIFYNNSFSWELAKVFKKRWISKLQMKTSKHCFLVLCVFGFDFYMFLMEFLTKIMHQEPCHDLMTCCITNHYFLIWMSSLLIVLTFTCLWKSPFDYCSNIFTLKIFFFYFHSTDNYIQN
jgi:hypothetical protein